MVLKIKIIQNKRLFLTAIFLFAIAVGFGFLKIKKVQAGYCVVQENDYAGVSVDTRTFSATSEADCKSKLSAGDIFITYTEDKAEAEAKEAENDEKLTQSSQGMIGVGQKTEDVCEGLKLLDPKTWINCLLIYVLQFLTGLLSISASLFTWIIDAKNITAVLSNSIIYTMWMLVRDVLNVAFILVLLFSAFCTVFQVEKYNYKQILRTLILMALLVNFSFPIARVIIDFSNVLMYYLIKTLNFTSNSGSFFVEIARNSDLGKIVYTHDAQASTPALIAAVVFTFILTVTLFVTALLFFIRIIALAILVIFSSVAFVGSIVPFLSSQASKWWDALFKYAFFGPIMIFMIIVSTKMMSVMSIGKTAIQSQALKQSGLTFVSEAAYFAIPIIILWMGMGFAQQLSISGASAVVGRGQKFMSSVGKWTGKAPFRGAWWGFKKTGIPGATKQRWEQYKTEGALGSEKTLQREARLAAAFGVKGAEEKDMKRRAEELKKKHITPDELKELASNGDAAAAYRLFEENEMDDNTYNKFMLSKSSSTLKEAVSKKAKQNRADLAINYKAKKEADKKVREALAQNPSLTLNQQVAIKIQEEQRVKEEEISKLSVENWQKQNWKDVIDNNPDMHQYIRDSFMNMTDQAKIEVAKTLHDQKATALRSIRVPV